jgi:ubiquinone biosynthesis protein UbiJ
MTIEEKLQTLTNGLQSLVEMQAQNEHRMAEMIKAMDRMNRRNAKLENFVTDIAEGTARLLHAVEEHERRITDLEGNTRE